MSLPVDMREVAEARHSLHLNHASHRPLSDGYELVGVAGEHEFARAFGLSVDTSARPSGDNGVDFHLPLFFTVDVKTARRPFNLIVEQGKPVADIVVLAGFDDFTGAAQLLGWAWGRTLLRSPAKDFGKGVINHFIPRDQLRAMAQLKARAVA